MADSRDETDRSGDATAEAVLAAATEEFAARGFHLTRVRDIATRAGANVAAISYHFGGKQELYLEVLRRQARARIRRYPIPSPDAATPDIALRFAITAILSRFLADDDSAVVPKLFVRELGAPTPALRTMIEDVIRPQFSALSAIVAQLLGPDAGPELVQRSAFSIVSQCIFYLFARPIVEVLSPQTLDGDAVERLALHIARFSLGGLGALRQQLEEKDA
ncbi:DUF1956 domain-containing protein [Sinimarinibacterium sp. CAU 1509]|uniref:CerR family C-terminal domain-containing protein n=1 Tax=Sinimarinibacterium sp. CAU 1509 TaxID=2562283 RepID=UPI0010ADA4C0|nr:CerR family C-terminal domain-containing protein [Sinimarinibacterium sp. CAU 1509]TJY62124.1 DUF1956 domain-containing protein [Sinimarinibacterium sp. CAU 1509]